MGRLMSRRRSLHVWIWIIHALAGVIAQDGRKCPANVDGSQSVKENTPIGTILLNFTVDAAARWTFVEDPATSFARDYLSMVIEGETGSIELNTTLDAERRHPLIPTEYLRSFRYQLTCTFEDRGTDINIRYPVTVFIQNVNDNVPRFIGGPYERNISELTPIMTTIFVLKDLAMDDDVDGSIRTYDIVKGSFGRFNISGSQQEGAIVVSEKINYDLEGKCPRRFRIAVSATGNPHGMGLTGPTSVGYVTVIEPLDYDKGLRLLVLNISATDNGAMYTDGKALTTYTTLTINVLDGDDRNPVFTEQEYSLTVQEEAPVVGEELVTEPPILAYDQDLGINMTINYEIVNGNVIGGVDYFKINKETGAIIPLQNLDRETVSGATLRIKGFQIDNPLDRYAIADVDVDIIDKDDNKPVLETLSYNKTIPENPAFGFMVLKLNATDPDLGPNGAFQYVIKDPTGALEVNRLSGEVYVVKPEVLDRETTPEIIVQIYAESISTKNRSDIAILRITLTDRNDNSPVFVRRDYSFNTLENATIGEQIGQIEAKDADAGDNARIAYAIFDSDNNGREKFGVHADNGSLYVKGSLAKPFIPVYRLVLTASDQATTVASRRTSTVAATVTVQDVNNHEPEFIKPLYEVSLSENTPEGTFVAKMEVKDPDGTLLEYKIVTGNEDGFFRHDKDGIIVVAKNITNIEIYNMTVKVSDGSYSAEAQLEVRITSVNDHAPVLKNQFYTVDAMEGYTPVTPIGKLVATDADGPTTRIFFNIVTGNDENIFELNRLTGALFVVNGQLLDRRKKKVHVLLVQAMDDGDPVRSTFGTIDVLVVDANNHPPKFDPELIKASIAENSTKGTPITTLKAVDEDTTGELSYYLTDDTEEVVEIDPETGMVSVGSVPLDREKQGLYSLNITVNDTIHVAYGTLELEILDINDHAPVFDETLYDGRVEENAEVDYKVLTVTATDKDTGVNSKMTYWITATDGKFNGIPNGSGMDIVVAAPLNDTTKKRYEMTLFVVDHGRPALTGSTTVIVHVNETNRHPPVFGKFAYDVSIAEDTKVGSVLLNIRTSDMDKGPAGDVVLTLIDSDSTFAITPTGSLSLTKAVDFEVKRVYQLKVRATDQGTVPMTAEAIVRITVTDVNDNAPKFVAFPESLVFSSNWPVGSKFYAVDATDDDSDTDSNNKVRYSLLSETENFSLNELTGSLKVKKSPLKVGMYNLEMEVNDLGTPRLSSKSTLIVEVKASVSGIPLFASNPYKPEVFENTAVPSMIQDVDANLGGSGPADVGIEYSLKEVDGTDTFSIDSSTGMIRMKRRIDREESAIRFLVVTARNINDPTLTAQAGVLVIVQDNPDQAPEFPFTSYDATVREDMPVGFRIATITASDKDQNPQLTYSVTNSDGTESKYFDVVNRDNSALLVVKAQPDRDAPGSKDVHHLKLHVSDGKLSDVTSVHVLVQDVNDNAPVFDNVQYTPKVYEDIGPGYEIIQMSASDADRIDAGKLTYFITQGDTSNQFDIDSKSGMIYRSMNLSNGLDREESDDYTLKVMVIDTAGNNSTVNVYLGVLDINDGRPRFLDPPFNIEVEEGAASLEDLGEPKYFEIRVTDPDAGDNKRMDVEFITGNELENFALSLYRGSRDNDTEANGTLPDQIRISLVKELDREQPGLFMRDGKGVMELLIRAKDRGTPSLSATATLTVTILDVNDSPPRFDKSFYLIPLTEGSPNGTVVAAVNASDPDNQPVLTYSIVDGNGDGIFAITADTGQLYLTGYPDRTVSDRYNLTVQVSDSVFKDQATMEIRLIDVNDNDPKFTQSVYKFSTPENDQSRQKNVVLGHVRATDRDDGSNGEVNYNITSRAGRDLFSISQNGTIKTVGILDRETEDKYIIIVTAEDNGNPSRRGTCEVEISIDDVNDNKPEYVGAPFVGSVQEGAPAGTVVNMSPGVRVSDRDANPGFVFELMDRSGMFAVDRRTGEIRVAKEGLDRERVPFYLVQLTVGDNSGRSPSLSALTTLRINILDINDNAPKFKGSVYEFSVDENTKPLTVLGVVNCTDADAGLNGQVMYEIVDGHGGDIYIERISGALFVTGSLDRETQPVYTLNVSAVDLGVPKPMTAFTTVKISLYDVNDNTPEFSTSHLRVEAPEESAPGEEIAVVRADDKDDGMNGALVYFLNETVPFEVLNNGSLVTRARLDMEERALYSFNVYARDRGRPSLTGTTKITVEVTDVNDHQPVFDRAAYTVSIFEKTPPGSVVLWPKVTDKDGISNANLSYSIVGDTLGFFNVDSKSGLVTVARDLQQNPGSVKPEAPSDQDVEYNMTLECSDQGSPPLSGQAELRVTLVKAIYNYPEFTKPSYDVYVKEEVKKGTDVVRVVAKIKDASLKVTYSLVDTNVYFAIDQNSGQISTTGERLDREQSGFHSFMVRASTKDGEHDRQDLAMVRITLEDVNDNSPFFLNTQTVYSLAEGAYKNHVLTTLLARDNDTEMNAEIKYTITQGNVDDTFLLNENDGRLMIVKTLDREVRTSYSLQIQASDGGQPPRSTSLSLSIHVLDVNDNTPKFSQPEFSVTLTNNQPGTEIIRLQATDADTSLNGKVFYDVVGDGQDSFYIDNSDGFGILRSLRTFDLRLNFSAEVTVRASDLGKPPREATTIVKIRGPVSNGVKPQFLQENYIARIDSETKPEVVLQTVSAGDGPYFYTISGGNGSALLTVDDASGDVRLSRRLDVSEDVTLTVDVTATNRAGEDTTTVTVHVSYIGSVPRFRARALTLDYLENRAPPVLLTDLSTSDEEKGMDVRYHILAGNGDGNFNIEERTGRLFCVKRLDRERVGSYLLRIRADRLAASTTRRRRETAPNEILVTIRVGDENDNQPRFQRRVYVVGIPADASFGFPVVKVKATDPDVNNLTYGIIAADSSKYFYMEPSEGQVRSSSNFARVKQREFSLIVEVNDGQEGDAHTDRTSAKVFVLSYSQFTILVAGMPAAEFSGKVDRIAKNLTDILGYEIKSAKIEPHVQSKGIGNTVKDDWTDMYFYAVNGERNTITRKTVLKKRIEARADLIQALFREENLVKFEYIPVKNVSHSIQTLEIVFILLSIVIFVGALVGVGTIIYLTKDNNFAPMRLPMSSYSKYTDVDDDHMSNNGMFLPNPLYHVMSESDCDTLRS